MLTVGLGLVEVVVAILRGKEEPEGTGDVSYLRHLQALYAGSTYLMSAVEEVCPKSNVCVELIPEVVDSLLASIDREGAPESDLGGVGAAH